MTLPIHLALVSQSNKVTFGDITTCAAAIAKQILRDFTPVWGVQATISAFPDLNHKPADYWPIMVRDDINAPGAAGYHDDSQGQPYALIQAGPGWQLTTSHEVCEILVDPSGNRTVAGQSPKPGQGRVLFLVEACDPCEGAQCAYTINGVQVSDFLTPAFFGPTAGACIKLDYSGKLSQPRQVIQDGYLSWLEPASNHWWQQIWFGGDAPQYRDLGVMTGNAGSVREWIDTRTNELSLPRLQASHELLSAASIDTAAADIARAHDIEADVMQFLHGQIA